MTDQRPTIQKPQDLKMPDLKLQDLKLQDLKLHDLKMHGLKPQEQKPQELTAQGRLDAMMAGCPVHSLRAKLKESGLRPTRQRMALGLLLFAKGDRHLTAEKLYEEAQDLRVPVSLATVYNGLHVFTEAGLLREVAVDGSKVYYDTNVSDHHHFLVENTNVLIDIPALAIDRSVVPDLPDGMEIAAIDVVVRLRPKA